VCGLLLGALCACDEPTPAKEPSRRARAEAQLTRVQGDYRVRAPQTGGAVELALKNGFTVRTSGELHGERWLELSVAAQRARAADIADDFLPVGPTVQWSLAQGVFDASFPAESFHLRRGYRLVLAVEAHDCAQSEPGSCFDVQDATFAEGRCMAAAVPAKGRRLQFGQLPAISAQGAHSVAP
jgi:hypothetical protein